LYAVAQGLRPVLLEAVPCVILGLVGMQLLQVVGDKRAPQLSGAGSGMAAPPEVQKSLQEVRGLITQMHEGVAEDERERILREVAEERARMRAEMREQRARAARILTSVLWLPLAGVLMLHGGAVLARFLFARVRFSVDQEGCLIFVHGIGGWRRHRWPLSRYSHLAVYMSPCRFSVPMLGAVKERWGWNVALSRAEKGVVGRYRMGPTFLLGQGRRPASGEPTIPNTLSKALSGLSRLTGLPLSKPFVASAPSDPLTGRVVVRRFRRKGPASMPLDALPPEWRAEAVRLLAEVAEQPDGRGSRGGRHRRSRAGAGEAPRGTCLRGGAPLRGPR